MTVKMPETRKKMKKPHPCWDKQKWKKKALKQTVQVELKFIQDIENNQFTDWGVMKKHIRKLFKNNDMLVNIVMI